MFGPALKQDVWMKIGTSRTLVFGPIVDINGAYVPLAGATAKWALAKSETSTGADILLTKTSTSGVAVPSGVDNFGATFYSVNVVFAPADTKGLPPSIPPVYWYHEVEVTDAVGNVIPVAIGRFHLMPSILSGP